MEERMHRQSGQTLLEVMVTVGLLGMFATIAIAPLEGARRRVSLIAATAEMRSVFQSARMVAVARDRNVALKFEEGRRGKWTWAVYVDGDGDGVRNDDIHRGVDKLLEPPKRFEHEPARIGVPKDPVSDPHSPGSTLAARSPVRFGVSGLCSFTRAGEASNGSMVLTDGEHVAIVRVTGGSARITVSRWDGKRWKEGE
jgi:prepilin-type N-terminal cleavage/methylation domain-containing protein